MNTRNLFIIAIVINCLLYCFSCSTTNIYSESSSPIDSLLIGEWYCVDIANAKNPLRRYFEGFQINNDHSRKLLGIETNTGKIKVIDAVRCDTIISAHDGAMIIKTYASQIIAQNHLKYIISNNKLTLLSDRSKTYTRTELNAQLFKPELSNVQAIVDSILLTNIKVSSFPLSFIKQNTASDIIFSARFPSSSIGIVVKNFNGAGTYNIPLYYARYSISYSDVGLDYSSDTTAAAVFIVDKYDTVNNTSSGSFSFNASGRYRNQDSLYEIRDGVFIVPIYR